MKFGIFYELQIPRPWGETSEYHVLADALTQIETADRLGFDYAWAVEHHFLEEYSISRTRTNSRRSPATHTRTRTSCDSHRPS